MRRTSRIISLVLIFSLLFLTLCGCRGGSVAGNPSGVPSADSSEGAGAESTVSQDDSPEDLVPVESEFVDPFPEEAYQVYQPGTPVPEEDWESVVEDHEKNGTLYHYVYDYTPMVFGPLEILSVYRYDRLPSYDSGEETFPAERFRDGWYLTLYYTMHFGGMGSETYCFTINDPGVFGAVERELFPLSFAPGADLNTGLPEVGFYADYPGRERIEYQILRDGTVIRNDSETATEKLSDEVTALFFAFRDVYVERTATYLYHYGSKSTDFPATVDPNVGAIRVEVRRGDEVRELSVEEGKAFLDLVSDPGTKMQGNEDSHFFNYRFRSNCGPEEHGDLLLHFSVYRRMREEDEIYDYDKREFDLYADGHVVIFYNYRASIPLVASRMDQLIVDRYFVSETAFDVDAILALLDKGP